MDVVMPDGTTIQGIPDGTSKADIAQKYASHLGSAAPSTAQPTATDQALASPLTRMATGIVKPLIIGMPSLLNSVANPLSALANLFPNSGPAKAYQAAMKAPSQAFDKPFNDAQAAVRNTPGYATARAQADAANAQFPSGMTDQLLPALSSSIAGIAGGGLYGDRANAYADSRQNSMDAFAGQHPLLAMGANIAGNLASAGPDASAVTRPADIAQPSQPTIPSIDDLRDAKNAAYAQVKQSGMTFTPEAMSDLYDNVSSQLKDWGARPALQPKTFAALDELKNASEDPATLQDFDSLRKVINQGPLASADRSEVAAGYQMRNAMDDWLKNVTPDAVSSPDGVDQSSMDALANARDLNTRLSKAELIDREVEKATNSAGANYTQAGFEQALRRRFTSLANNDAKFARFNPDEQDAILKIVRGGPASDMFRFVGRFAPRGPMATFLSSALGAGGGALIGGIPGAAIGAGVLPGIGEAAKQIATAGTTSNVDALSQLVRNGSIVPKIPAPVSIGTGTIPASALVPFGAASAAAKKRIPLLLSGQPLAQ